jgi:hypothetical protein
MAKKAGGNTSTPGDLYDNMKGGFNAPTSGAVYAALKFLGGTVEEMNYGYPLNGQVPENKAEESKWQTVNVGKAPRPKH